MTYNTGYLWNQYSISSQSRPAFLTSVACGTGQLSALCTDIFNNLRSTLLRYLSAASVVCQLPPAAHYLDVRSSVVGPVAWNLLPDGVRDPTHLFDSFWRDLKTFLFLSLLAHTVH